MSTAGTAPKINAIIEVNPELMNIIKQEFLISGLKVYAYSHKSSLASDKPIQVHFMLHWRLANCAAVDSAARKAVLLAQAMKDREHDLVVIVFDHRNHGVRQVELRANQSWDEGNPTHAPDMYSIVLGSAHDVSMLIDLLPCYLLPHTLNRQIVDWGVSGVSLGGHTAWVLMAREPRLSHAVIVIGCPSYSKLVTDRCISSGYPQVAPYLPQSFLDLVQRTSAENVPYTKNDKSNPFYNKKLMIIVGGEKDVLVPWKESREYVMGLNVGPKGIKKVHIHQEAGHEFNKEMIDETASFIASYGALPENLPAVN
ncbi:Alpha/Beta hydrolase protein [Pterulicium gracile]|uniref:Alpha/Beta hydrolase protein n=1 Tax=Pterulicium gracile TaxID=1884261 RepID=A0A5C3QJZ1_9AGAR|nr:Alpha/Beta hydrolase protein [Pterula gracilis]